MQLISKWMQSHLGFSINMSVIQGLYASLFSLLCLFIHHGVCSEPDISDILSFEGIEIPYIRATTACKSEQPQRVHNKYGYVISPREDFATHSQQFNCTWLVIAEEYSAIQVRLDHFTLTGSLRLDLYDGPHVNSPLIANFSHQWTRASVKSKSEQLLIHYYGEARFADTSEFRLYVEWTLPDVTCVKNMIACRNGVKCVDKAHWCDDDDDCGDGTDEEDCPNEDLYFLTGCGLQNAIIDPLTPLKIVGGEASLPNSWPWMVSLRLKEKEPSGHTCGGSIINRKWVLTAAHCILHEPDISKWTVNAGKYQKMVRDSTEVVRYIKRRIVHEHFIGTAQDDGSSNLTWYDFNVNDIALLELNAPLPDGEDAINAICIANASYPIRDGMFSYVTGWGNTYETGNDFVLKEALVPIISNQMCHSWMPSYNIGPKMLCAGYEEGGEDSCQGDSGGPLFVSNENNTRYYQIGIVSTGDLCAAKREAGIYTRLPSFAEWIHNVTIVEFE